ncbi:MAG: restriction endonuclease subunit S [Vicinamibacterales bacterium]
MRDVPQKLHVKPKDLLVSWSASLGVFEWSGPDVALLNQHIFRVVPDERRVDKSYLRYGLERALTEMQRHLHGATMQHVNRGEFLSTKLFVPSLPEQRRIAEILDKADALRAKRAALAQLDTLTQSIFIDMFGDPATHPKGWVATSVAEIADVQGGLK